MNSKQIIGHLMANTGKTVTELANEHGYSKQAWYDVIKGRTKTPQLRSVISGLTKKPESILWAEFTEEAA